jgi:two-component system, cell cycle sensor histidine kinase and response regulator CckA
LQLSFRASFRVVDLQAMADSRGDVQLRHGSAEAVVDVQAAERLPEPNTVRILIIDDDPQARALIEMALSDARFEPVLEVAPTAHAGLERIRADEHDVYLVDQQLPDGLGLSVIHDARAGGAHKPFILMTGYGSGALDEEASREGASDYVEKHLVSSHLERSIRYTLRTWQAMRLLHDRDEQLRQAQKMEAIGRLAGGVAHDFNNLLTAIIGYTDLVAERLTEADQLRRDVAEIRKAADRGAALTRQLLSFSRKQFLNPTVLDLNDTASGLLHMLPRAIGEHIRTTVRLAPDLARVKADASQMEQVLVNLVLNARDAMPSGGQLTIETANVTLSEPRLRAEGLTVAPGFYVMLCVTDTGIGMDAATRARAFEPFFTTKPKGKGTGLGLATVYGIVDQSGGGVSLETAPARGTTVRIYLPATNAAVEAQVAEVPAMRDGSGTETLLLVEDNDSVRDLAARALRRRGYTVHEARDAEEAIEWSMTSGIRPDLLVTDVVMPGISGPNLAARLLQKSPQLRVLYMSGYTDDATAVHGNFWGGVPLLQKPFTPGALAERVRLALDSAPGQA